MEVQQATNEVTTTKMEGPGRVTTKDPKNVAVGKRLAEYSHKKREGLAQATKAQKSESEPKLTSSQYYALGLYSCWGVRCSSGYYIHQSKKGNITKVTLVHQSKKKTWLQFSLQNFKPTSSKCSSHIFLDYKIDKKSIVNDLYQAVVISIFAILVTQCWVRRY